MNPLTTDSSAWLKTNEDILEGLSGVYVDDVVQAGTPGFDVPTDMLSKEYDTKEKEYGDGRIAGIELRCSTDGIRVNQEQYLLAKIPPERCII
jgi:hypothetical protein